MKPGLARLDTRATDVFAARTPRTQSRSHVYSLCTEILREKERLVVTKCYESAFDAVTFICLNKCFH